MRTLDRKTDKKFVPNDPVMTKAKFLILKDKLERLQKSQPQAASEVSRLAELGDFSENTEYQMAKWKLRGINSSIQRIQNELDGAEIIETSGDGNIVEVGSKVTVVVNGKEKIFEILGSTETDPKKGIVSRHSPVGSALLGCRVGDKAVVKVTAGEVIYEVKKIW